MSRTEKKDEIEESSHPSSKRNRCARKQSGTVQKTTGSSAADTSPSRTRRITGRVCQDAGSQREAKGGECGSTGTNRRFECYGRGAEGQGERADRAGWFTESRLSVVADTTIRVLSTYSTVQLQCNRCTVQGRTRMEIGVECCGRGWKVRPKKDEDTGA